MALDDEADAELLVIGRPVEKAEVMDAKTLRGRGTLTPWSCMNAPSEVTITGTIAAPEGTVTHSVVPALAEVAVELGVPAAAALLGCTPALDGVDVCAGRRLETGAGGPAWTFPNGGGLPALEGTLPPLGIAALGVGAGRSEAVGIAALGIDPVIVPIGGAPIGGPPALAGTPALPVIGVVGVGAGRSEAEGIAALGMDPDCCVFPIDEIPEVPALEGTPPEPGMPVLGIPAGGAAGGKPEGVADGGIAPFGTAVARAGLSTLASDIIPATAPAKAPAYAEPYVSLLPLRRLYKT
jgi:hypothetical protein